MRLVFCVKCGGVTAAYDMLIPARPDAPHLIWCQCGLTSAPARRPIPEFTHPRERPPMLRVQLSLSEATLQALADILRREDRWSDHVLGQLKKGQEAIMTELTDVAEAVRTGDSALISTIEQVLTQNEAAAQARVDAAVRAALEEHGVEDAAVTGVLKAVRDANADEMKRLQAILNPVSQALTIDVSGLSSTASVGADYSGQINVTGGTAPYTISVGGLPDGLSADAAGLVTGQPGTPGGFSYSVSVSDSAGGSASTGGSISVAG